MAALILWPGALRLDLFPLFAQLYASRVQAMAVLLGLGTVVLVLARGAGDCGGWPSFCSP